MQHRKTLRASFVTVTATALLGAGCDGVTTYNPPAPDVAPTDSAPSPDTYNPTPDVTPPADVPPTTDCPMTAPADRAYCNYIGAGCNFDRCYPGSIYYGTHASCDGNRWNVSTAPCNPLPDVPPSDAVVDAPSDAPADVASDAPADVASDASPCPMTSPTPGERCPSDPPSLMCHYGDCFGSPTITASCESGVWAVSIRSCNPPFDAGSDR